MESGQRINGKYRLVRVIGDGGMGVVYEARHEVLGTPVALKFLHAELARKPNVAARFLREARVSATIQSPYVTRVSDVETTPEGVPFLVMELLTGESLQAHIERRGRIPVAEAIGIMAQVLLGIEAAHAIGVIHRDLKPENVFLCETKHGFQIKLLDFGVAKVKDTSSVALDEKGLTRPGSIMGTPEYMAPEQMFNAEYVDHRADVFSAGVILYEMLSGRRPADGDSPQEIVSQVASGRITLLRSLVPDIPEELAAVVHQAMHSHVSQRFPSAAAMRIALANFSAGVSATGREALDAPPSAVAPNLARLAQDAEGGPVAVDETVRSAEEAANLAKLVGPEAASPAPAAEPVAYGRSEPPRAAPPREPQAAGLAAAPGAAVRCVSGGTAELPPLVGAAPQQANASPPGGSPQVPRISPYHQSSQQPPAVAPWQQPGGYARPSPIMSPYPVAPPPQQYPYYNRPRASSDSATRWLVGGLIAFGIALIVTLVLLIQSSRHDSDDVPPLPQPRSTANAAGNPPPVIIAPEGLVPDDPVVVLPQPTATAADAGATPQPAGTGTSKPPVKDAGTDAGGATVIIVPTPWPFPTSIPTVFPLPTWPPPLPTPKKKK